MLTPDNVSVNEVYKGDRAMASIRFISRMERRKNPPISRKIMINGINASPNQGVAMTHITIAEMKNIAFCNNWMR